METVGTIAELWRYPVKGMRGESQPALALDAHGVVGDRRFAFESSRAPHGKPLLRGDERAAMLLYSAAMLDGDTFVTTPSREEFPVDDPQLIAAMQRDLPGGGSVHLVRSETPLTDVRPLALLGLATVTQLGDELGSTVDARRFRANILLRMERGFAEDELVGREICVGETAVLRVLERDPRCRIVTLDPVTAEADPSLMKLLDRRHEGRVGVYAAVVQPGELRVGDAVRVK